MNNLYIIIPMAGTGSRFSKYGFSTNKFLLPIDQYKTTMIEYAINTLNPPPNCTIIMGVNVREYNIIYKLVTQHLTRYNIQLVKIDTTTNGPATTVYKCVNAIKNPDIPIVTSNSDQILHKWSVEDFVNNVKHTDGAVLTYFPSYKLEIGSTDKHSFVGRDKNLKINKFSEKIVLSNEALVGVHYFKNKQVFLDAYNDMVKNQERAPNGEYYLSLMYNSLVRQSLRVKTIPLERGQEFYPVGEPADYFHYLNTVTKYGPKQLYGNIHEYIRVCTRGNVEISSPSICIVVNGNIFSQDKNYRAGDIFIATQSFEICNTSKRSCIIIISHPSIKSIPTYKRSNLAYMKRGWCIGDFEPCFYRTNIFEVGVLNHRKDEVWPFHIHNKCEEYNYIISGTININDNIYKSGDIFMFQRGHPAAPKFLDDCTIVCVKTPSIPTDKEII